MTIKKLALSTVTAAMVTTGAFAAGTITATAQTVGAEGVVVKSYLNNVDVNTSYTASINGTLNQGSFIYTISNAELNATIGSNLAVWNMSTTSRPAITSSCANGSTGKIICDINGTITDGDVLILGDSNGTATANPTASIDMNLSAGFSGSTVAVLLTNSATTTIDTPTAATLLTTATEWTTGTTVPFSNQIDASNEFLSFVASTDANATITLANSPADLGAQTVSLLWSIMPDQNTSSFGSMVIAAAGAENQGVDNNYTSAAITAAGTYHADFTPNGSDAIKEATFTHTLSGTTGNGADVNLIASTTTLGGFTTYGYNGNIPGASYSAGVTDTKITLLNNQATANADTVVVIKDAAGSDCTLTSATDSEVAKPGANASVKYTLSTMLGNSKCSALTGTLYSIQLTLPTTPTNVFSQAAVVRSDSTAGISKVLPVYSNGTKY